MSPLALQMTGSKRKGRAGLSPAVSLSRYPLPFLQDKCQKARKSLLCICLRCKEGGTRIRIKDVWLFAEARPKLGFLSLSWEPASQFMKQSAIDYVMFKLIFTDRGHHE